MLPVSEVSFPYLNCCLFEALSAFFRYEDARWRILQPRRTRKRKILWSKHRWPWYMTPRRGNEERKLSSVLLLFSCCCLTRRDEYVYVARATLLLHDAAVSGLDYARAEHEHVSFTTDPTEWCTENVIQSYKGTLLFEKTLERSFKRRWRRCLV